MNLWCDKSDSGQGIHNKYSQFSNLSPAPSLSSMAFPLSASNYMDAPELLNSLICAAISSSHCPILDFENLNVPELVWHSILQYGRRFSLRSELQRPPLWNNLAARKSRIDRFHAEIELDNKFSKGRRESTLYLSVTIGLHIEDSNWNHTHFISSQVQHLYLLRSDLFFDKISMRRLKIYGFGHNWLKGFQGRVPQGSDARNNLFLFLSVQCRTDKAWVMLFQIAG